MQDYQVSHLQDGGQRACLTSAHNKIYFTPYSGTDTKGSQELIPNSSFRQFYMVHILNDCMCVT